MEMVWRRLYPAGALFASLSHGPSRLVFAKVCTACSMLCNDSDISFTISSVFIIAVAEDEYNVVSELTARSVFCEESRTSSTIPQVSDDVAAEIKSEAHSLCTACSVLCDDLWESSTIACVFRTVL